MISANN